MAARILLSNEANSGRCSDDIVLHWQANGAVAATVKGGAVVIPAGFAGEIIAHYLVVDTNTTAGTTSITGTLANGGTAVCSTEPKIDDTASTGSKTTYVSGTGLTQAVLKTDGSEDVVAGDILTYSFTAAGTTPDGEGYGGIVVIRRSAA